MTWILSDRNRLDGRSYRDRIGKPYYGSALRRVIEPEEQRRSFIERVSDAWESWGAKAFWGLLALMVLGAVAVAMVIVAAS